MCRINLLVICQAMCALALCAEPENELPPKIDRFKNPEAWIRDPNRPRADSPRPVSPEMEAVDPYHVNKLTAEELARMSLDDPLLKYAYAQVFNGSLHEMIRKEPPQQLALADMRRRGESVSPMLIKLIEENKETRIESTILCNIHRLDTVRIEPYLEYARKLLRERTRSEIAAEASFLLAEKGTNEDIKLLEWLLEQEPYADYDIKKNLKALRTRLQPSTNDRPVLRDRPSASEASGGGSADEVKGVSSTSVGMDAAMSWIKWVLFGLVLIGILWQLLRKGGKQRG